MVDSNCSVNKTSTILLFVVFEHIWRNVILDSGVWQRCAADVYRVTNFSWHNFSADVLAAVKVSFPSGVCLVPQSKSPCSPYPPSYKAHGAAYIRACVSGACYSFSINICYASKQLLISCWALVIFLFASHFSEHVFLKFIIGKRQMINYTAK